MRLQQVTRDKLSEGAWWQRGHFGPSRTLTVQGGPEIWIGAGQADRIEVFKDTDTGWLFVLVENPDLGYWGMEVFDGTSLIGELFCDTEADLRELLYPDGAGAPRNGRFVEDPKKRIRRLTDYATGHELRERESRAVPAEGRR